MRVSAAELVLVIAACEWATWCVLTWVVRDRPRCPLCKGDFLWGEVAVYAGHGHRVRQLSFPCPKCGQIIGAPNWRRGFLKVFYIVLVLCFIALFWEITAMDSLSDMMIAMLGAALGSIGSLRIMDWFIWRRLEPGRPSRFTT